MDKKLMSISISMLVLKLLEENDMYGYQMIKELEERSERVFELKEGTLDPVLHALEEKLAIESYEKQTEAGRTRKYYHITKQGKKLLDEKTKEWDSYQKAIGGILRGVTSFA
jgi:PadR family transcriptional regulator PadR